MFACFEQNYDDEWDAYFKSLKNSFTIYNTHQGIIIEDKFWDVGLYLLNKSERFRALWAENRS